MPLSVSLLLSVLVHRAHGGGGAAGRTSVHNERRADLSGDGGS